MTSATEPEYDPISCIDAGQLRAAGFKIPDRIPDCAWVPRSSMRTQTQFGPADPEQRRLPDIELIVSFTEPFRWLDVTGTIAVEQEV